MLVRIALVAFALFQSGCIVLYVPDPSRADTRGAIEDADLRPFNLDVTTRQEILLALGEPDLQSGDGSVVMYWWYSHRGFLLWAVAAPNGGAAGAAGMVGKRIYLCIKFDSEGKVSRHKFIHVSDTLTKPSQPQPTPAGMLALW